MQFGKALRMLAAAGVLLGMTHVLMLQFTTPADRFHMFLYERGPVQHITLFVTCIAGAMLWARVSQYCGRRKQFNRCQAEKSPPPDLAQRLQAVEKALSKDGMSAALSQAGQLADDQAARTHKAHETLTHIIGILPVLGLLGTLLGLNEGLFVAFGSGTAKTESVMQFVAALATALDTTILAAFCSVPLFTAAFLLGRAEKDLDDQYAAQVRRQFNLRELPESETTARVLQGELRKVVSRIAVEAKAAFARILEDSADAYRDRLAQAVDEAFSAQRKHEMSLIEKLAAEVASGLGQSVHRVGDLLERHNGRLAEDMICHFGQLERTLRDGTPKELVIRYQHAPSQGRNGHDGQAS
jgi:biopolymer transport protein ExbB/TolQ